eukprot:573746-Rhodomonas_salina.1
MSDSLLRPLPDPSRPPPPAPPEAACPEQPSPPPARAPVDDHRSGSSAHQLRRGLHSRVTGQKPDPAPARARSAVAHHLLTVPRGVTVIERDLRADVVGPEHGDHQTLRPVHHSLAQPRVGFARMVDEPGVVADHSGVQHHVSGQPSEVQVVVEPFAPHPLAELVLHHSLPHIFPDKISPSDFLCQVQSPCAVQPGLCYCGHELRALECLIVSRPLCTLDLLPRVPLTLPRCEAAAPLGLLVLVVSCQVVHDLARHTRDQNQLEFWQPWSHLVHHQVSTRRPPSQSRHTPLHLRPSNLTCS